MKLPSIHRSWMAIAGVLLAALAVWWLLGFWVAHGSERFYLVLPPLALGLVAASSAQPWQDAKQWLRGAYIILGFWIVLCTAGSVLLFGGLWLPEVLLAAYFILALKVLLMAPMRLGHHLWRGTASVEAPRGFWSRQLIALLAAPLLIPFVVGALYVHRFKVPNVSAGAVAGRSVEDVSFVTADGLTLRGWFIAAPEPSARTLLVCHGLAANRTAFLPLTPVGDVLEANILFFDFRGHGDSDGHTITYGVREKEDVLAAIAYLRRERPEQAREIVGLGLSMGAACLIRGAAEAEPPLDALILDSAYASAVELTDNVLGDLPAFVRPLIATPAVPLASLDAGCWLPDARPIDCVDRLRAPTLFIHARGDALIPYEHSCRLYARAAGPKELWLTDTGGHCSSFGSARVEYLHRVSAILQTRGDGQRTARAK
jgi:fermentation-respiration switch protein FrsA (DUF1100 family)